MDINKVCFLVLILAGEGVVQAQTNIIPSSGSVGIGTTSPIGNLDIRPDNSWTNTGIVFTSTAQNPSIRFYRPTGGGANSYSWYLRAGGSSSSSFDILRGGATLVGSESPDIMMSIKSSGNVGIGDTSPSYLLTLGGVGSAGIIGFNRANDGGSIFTYGFASSSESNEIRASHVGGGGYFTWVTNSGGVSEKMRISNNGNIGIGTSSPDYKFSVESDDFISAKFERKGSGGGIGIKFVNAEETGEWTTGVGSNDHFGIYKSDNVFGQQFLITSSGNVGVGTTSPTQKLTVAGTINSQEIIVEEDAGADFVFESGYDLPTLPEVEAFVSQNNHLPGIAPASEMIENGVKVGELQMQLLQKIEELTLYTIEQQGQIEELKEKNRILFEKIESMIEQGSSNE